jgi:hypothetical protein
MSRKTKSLQPGDKVAARVRAEHIKALKDAQDADPRLRSNTDVVLYGILLVGEKLRKERAEA